jgi:outer membrane protein assembly factor BamA
VLFLLELELVVLVASVSTGISEKNLFGKGINVNSNINLGTESIKGNILTSIPDFNNSDNDLIYDFT